MSKMDNLRAMREARYAEAQKRAAGSPAKPVARPPVAPATPAARQKSAPVVATREGAAPTSVEELCGHRNMSGRTCTRERGHAAKSHRYS
jgi:hypothetical protein